MCKLTKLIVSYVILITVSYQVSSQIKMCKPALASSSIGTSYCPILTSIKSWSSKSKSIDVSHAITDNDSCMITCKNGMPLTLTHPMSQYLMLAFVHLGKCPVLSQLVANNIRTLQLHSDHHYQVLRTL